MDKARHPHVVRTWTVERTKQRYQAPQPVRKTQLNPRHKNTAPPGPAPKPAQS